MRFDAINTTYNALMHNHALLTPYLNRGGTVYSSLNESGWRWQEVETHPVFYNINLRYTSKLDTLTVSNWKRKAKIDLFDCPARHEFATKPPLTRLYIDRGEQAVDNETGVRVIDVLRTFCDHDYDYSAWRTPDWSQLSVDVGCEKEGLPVLWFTD
jgi:hypothetical protein